MLNILVLRHVLCRHIAKAVHFSIGLYEGRLEVQARGVPKFLSVLATPGNEVRGAKNCEQVKRLREPRPLMKAPKLTFSGGHQQVQLE